MVGCCFVTTAQEKFSDRRINGYANGGYGLLNILSLADIGLPTIQPGFAYKINKRLGIEVAFGIPVKYLNWVQTTDSTYHRYYKLRTTLRYYIYQNRGYLGFETFYTHSHYTTYHYRYSNKNSGETIYSDFAESIKSIIALDLKYAWIFRISEKFYVENFIGVGIRFVKLDLPVNINPITYGGGLRDGLHIRGDVLGSKVDPHLTFGLQLAYRL